MCAFVVLLKETIEIGKSEEQDDWVVDVQDSVPKQTGSL